MRVFLFGTPESCRRTAPFFEDCQTEFFFHLEALTDAMHAGLPDAFFSIMDGAAGMEGAMAARRIAPELPVAWFSGDLGFAPQAFRIQVNYFGTLPITPHKIQEARKKCLLFKS